MKNLTSKLIRNTCHNIDRAGCSYLMRLYSLLIKYPPGRPDEYYRAKRVPQAYAHGTL